MKVTFECKRCGKVSEKDVSPTQDFKPQYCDKCLDYIFGKQPPPEQSTLPKLLLPDKDGLIYD